MSLTRHPWADPEWTSFAIYRMQPHPPGGGMGHVRTLLPGAGSEFTLVASALNLAREALVTPMAKDVLTHMALKWDHGRDHRIFEGDRARARRAAEYFINRVRDSPPKIIVDENLDHRHILASHPRLTWSGVNFRSQDQTVCINARRCDDMVRALTSNDGPQFRYFQFILACTFLNEIGGHMFITFLGHNRDGHPAPPRTKHQGCAKKKRHGLRPEFVGDYLETLLFGGVLESFPDPRKGIYQSGNPHLRREDNTVMRIPQRCVDEFVTYRFTFPFRTTGRPLKAKNRESMGRPHAPIPMLHPNAHPVLAPKPKIVQGYRIDLEQLRQISKHPLLRLTVLKNS